MILVNVYAKIFYKTLRQLLSKKTLHVWHREAWILEKKKIQSSKDADQLLRSIWNWEAINFNEEFVAIYLNRANQVLGVYKHYRKLSVHHQCCE